MRSLFRRRPRRYVELILAERRMVVLWNAMTPDEHAALKARDEWLYKVLGGMVTVARTNLEADR